VALAIIWIGLVGPAVASPHFALVLGNNAYQSLPPLPACQASASTVSAALRRSGWTVRDVRDPSNGQMGAAIGAFGDAMEGAGCGRADLFLRLCHHLREPAVGS